MKKLFFEIPQLPYSTEEALNRLRINIKFCGKDTKKILITSSVPNEGKSLVAFQLWKMLAEAGFKTAFVDLDFRNSSIIREFGMHMLKGQEKTGFENYISGLAEYEDVVYETNVENGYFVPCFNLLENPSALLSDRRLKEALNRLAEEYRYVIIDTPPIEMVSDALQIAPYCDGNILVIRAGDTSRKLVKECIDQLQRTNTKLLGVVMNRVETSGRQYGYGYGKYGKYGKYYGKYYGNNKDTGK